MDEFLEVFGGMRLGTVVLLIAAFIFMWKTYKKVEAYFKDKYEMEAEKRKANERYSGTGATVS